LNFLLNNLGSIFFNLAQIISELFVFLFAFFYLLRDGEKIKQAIIKLSPLNKEDDEIIIEKISGAINSVIKGSLLVALIQGALLAVGLFIFSVPNPVLWGAVSAIGALIPMVGTTIVILPAALYLYLNGQVLAALGVLLWGTVFVGLAENLIRPPLVGRGMSLHPLLVLLSVLGGLSFFGPFGLIFGPLVATLFVVLIDICSTFIVKNTC
jgi:predicted PurR-regulated permease PerM